MRRCDSFSAPAASSYSDFLLEVASTKHSSTVSFAATITPPDQVDPSKTAEH
jgi:hypothetical protein